ncbi:hypothetical protein B0H19DRAFT_1368857 [Mycena capillaripes]|nr:hypothetical protein B0H19DRAFT_1368857 [Mycena capillaripes]
MNDQLSIQQSLRRLRDSPKQVIESAKCGSIPDLKDLANFWQEVPDLLSLGIFDVFFHHLNPDKAFAVPSEANERSPLAACAFYALFGLSKSGDYLLRPPHNHDPAVLKAWPGIFKWSAFFFKMRVTSVLPRPVEARRSAMDVIATVWYCLVRVQGLREVIAATKGTVEIATQLWLLDNEVPYQGPPSMNIPCVAAFDAVLVDHAATDRALAAAGGAPDTLVKLVSIYLDLLSHLSWGADHPLRLGLLQAGAISLCTRAAGTLAGALNAGGDLDLLNSIVSAFGFLTNCLHSTEGFTWVIQSVGADFLLAWADASPHFAQLDEEDYGMVTSLLMQTLPMYLVYRSVIQAVEQGMRRLGPQQLERINSSIAKNVWMDFRKLAEERSMVVVHAAAVKGKAATCDNVKCHKIDAKNTFRKCGGCSTTLYCSKECQTIAWKEGGHKAMCKMKQRERLEGKSLAISKSDIAFFHHLAVRDARHHLPLLRRLARTEHPALRSCDLLIRIDYTVVPPAYSIIPLAVTGRDDLPTSGSANADARNDAIFERVRENPEQHRLIQSQIVNGAVAQMVLSVVTGNFWEDGDAEGHEEEGGMETNVDDVDFMMARTALDGFLANRGRPPAF